jgi:hypothetical protein
MKRLFIVLLILTQSIYWAQTQELQKTIKKLYLTEDNVLFINKYLGVYLWLSVSPDSNSEKYKLLSDTSKQYSNPMYFDTEGYNTFYSPSAVDTSTKQVVFPKRDIVFRVYADGLPPASISIHAAKKSHIIEGKKYYGGDLIVRISSNDDVSGIQSVFYSLNDQPFTEYKNELTSFKAGENKLKYYAVDKVGNSESVKTETYYIDNVPPKTEYELIGMLNGNYVSPDAVIKLKSSDDLSGVKTIYYKINEGNLFTYINPIPVKVLGNNEGSISFYAEDYLGNKEDMSVIGGKSSNLQIKGLPQNVVFEFYVDNDPPILKLDIKGDLYKGKNQYVSSRTRFMIIANDEKAGVDKVFYSINSTNVDQLYKEPFAPEKGGLHSIRVKAVDYVGNTSPVLTNLFICDINPPKTALSIGLPKLDSRDTFFISDKSRIRLTSADDLAGVLSTSYIIDNNNEEDYRNEFVIEKPGRHIITYYSLDNVYNQEQKNSQEIFVDMAPPFIHHHFSVESIGSKIIRDEPCTVYPPNVMLYIAATDASSGGERIDYSINGGPTLTENPLIKLKPGNYLIDVKAYDVLGNQSTTQIKFAIEE